jgi:N4-gp56 family major capsid protein
MAQIYGNGSADPKSSVGPQFNESYWDRRSLIEVSEEMYFSPLADVKQMPKHYGKELKVYFYVPLLDDRNISDQGIDANGVSFGPTQFQAVLRSTLMVMSTGGAATALRDAINAIDAGIASVQNTNEVVVTRTATSFTTQALADAVVAAGEGYAAAYQGHANVYGSSKDVGTIAAKMPALSEESGRVNRVGFTRLELKGTIAEYGFFTDFTEDSFTFDTDSELYGHMSREMLEGANQINEDLLQMDLLSAAGVKVYPGTATQDRDMTGATDARHVITLRDLKRMSITLDDNRTPKKTTIIKGSLMTDTRVISASRVMFIGSELQLSITELVDTLGKAAFVPVEKYADAGTILNGEIGAIPAANLRVVVVPNMMHWAGAGADATTNAGYSETNGHFDVFPMLVVGDSSFATIGLQGASGGKATKQKFKIIVKKPSKENADRNDPYGKLGFSSISFWYGFISLRPERMAVAKSLAAT